MLSQGYRSISKYSQGHRYFAQGHLTTSQGHRIEYFIERIFEENRIVTSIEPKVITEK